MEMIKSQEYLILMDHIEFQMPTRRDNKPISFNPEERKNTDALLEELGSIIESEGGVLIP